MKHAAIAPLAVIAKTSFRKDVGSVSAGRKLGAIARNNSMIMLRIQNSRSKGRRLNIDMASAMRMSIGNSTIPWNAMFWYTVPPRWSAA